MKLLERKLLSFTSKIEREISIFSFFFHQLCRLLLLILQLNRRIIFTIFSSYLYSVCCSFFPCTNIQKRKKNYKTEKSGSSFFLSTKKFSFCLLIIHSFNRFVCVSFIFYIQLIFPALLFPLLGHLLYFTVLILIQLEDWSECK